MLLPQITLVSVIPCVIQTIRSIFTAFEFGSYFPSFAEMFYFRVSHFPPRPQTPFSAGLKSVPLLNAYRGCLVLHNAAWNLKRTTYFFSRTNECSKGITRWFLCWFKYTSLALLCNLSAFYRQAISCIAAQWCKRCPSQCLREAEGGCQSLLMWSCKTH